MHRTTLSFCTTFLCILGQIQIHPRLASSIYVFIQCICRSTTSNSALYSLYLCKLQLALGHHCVLHEHMCTALCKQCNMNKVNNYIWCQSGSCRFLSYFHSLCTQLRYHFKNFLLHNDIYLMVSGPIPQNILSLEINTNINQFFVLILQVGRHSRNKN